MLRVRENCLSFIYFSVCVCFVVACNAMQSKVETYRQFFVVVPYCNIYIYIYIEH